MFIFQSEMAVNASLKHGKGARKISCQLAFATTPAKIYGVRGISKQHVTAKGGDCKFKARQSGKKGILYNSFCTDCASQNRFKISQSQHYVHFGNILCQICISGTFLINSNKANSPNTHPCIKILVLNVLVVNELVGTMLVGTVLVETKLVGFILVGNMLVGTALVGTKCQCHGIARALFRGVMRMVNSHT